MSAATSTAATAGTAAEYCSKTAMGQLRCKLCDTLHKDEAHFKIHVDGNKHQNNLKLIQVRRDQMAQEHTMKQAIAKQAEHDAHQQSLAGLLNNNAAGDMQQQQQQQRQHKAARGGAAAGVAPPEVKFHIEEIGANRMHSRVTFTISFPLAPSDGRPLHRWMNTFEQGVEPRDASKMYLVFACEPYQSIAYTFPSNLSVATADNSGGDLQRYFCRWDPDAKTYTLMFHITYR